MNRRLPFILVGLVFTAACSGGGAGEASSSTNSGAGGGASSAIATTSASTGAGGDGGAGGGGAGGGSSASGTIVPLYTYPTDPTWASLVSAKKAHPAVEVRAIINPASGPGPSSDPAYQAGISDLKAAGVVVIGYVATTYSQKQAPLVQSEIDAYLAYYPALDGIFFDEMSNTAGDEAYYAQLDQYAKAKGLAVTVGNPGTSTQESFVGTLDTILIYESSGLPDGSVFGGFVPQHDKRSFGVIPYGVPALDTAFVSTARQSVGFVYVTNDVLPNPWDSLPPYFDSLLAALE